jgi:hypothetical protein
MLKWKGLVFEIRDGKKIVMTFVGLKCDVRCKKKVKRNPLLWLDLQCSVGGIFSLCTSVTSGGALVSDSVFVCCLSRFQRQCTYLSQIIYS